MIPFFRKIRKKMADDNKPLKYARYAIGEIILVVIGILIALQINNWNEDKKERRIENKYINRLTNDLRVDMNYHNKRIEQAENDLRHLDMFISQMSEFQKNTHEIVELFKHLHLNTDPFASANSTFSELLSTGDFKTFSNDTLKNLIIDYYRINDDFINQMEEFNLVSTNLLVENAVINPNISKILAWINSVFDESYIIDGEFDFINNPKSLKFQMLRNTASFYRRRNMEHLTILKQMRLNAEQMLFYIEKKNTN